MPNSLRNDVAEAVRRAAGLIYVQSHSGMTYDHLARQLGNKAVNVKLITRWAEEDQWEQRRADAIGQRAVSSANQPPEGQGRAARCLRAVEKLHNDAVVARRGLRAKSWEQAAMIQLRCAEALRDWSIQEMSKDDAKKADAEVGGPPPIEADSVLSDEQWQELAHVALATRNKKEHADGAQ